MSINKVNPKNIKDIEGICTLVDVVTSDQVIEFYNQYVVANNKQKYAAISKSGVVYAYDEITGKHTKLGVQKDNSTSLYAINTHYVPEETKPIVEEVQQPIEEEPITQCEEVNQESQVLTNLQVQLQEKDVLIEQLKAQLSEKPNVVEIIKEVEVPVEIYKIT